MNRIPTGMTPRSGMNIGSRFGGSGLSRSINSSNSKEEQLARLTNRLHGTNYRVGWIILSFTLVLVIVSIGLVGGIFETIDKDMRPEKFETFCYATWGVMAGAFLFLIGFVIYYNMHASYIHNQSINNINDIYGTRYTKKEPN